MPEEGGDPKDGDGRREPAGAGGDVDCWLRQSLGLVGRAGASGTRGTICGGGVNAAAAAAAAADADDSDLESTKSSPGSVVAGEREETSSDGDWG